MTGFDLRPPAFKWDLPGKAVSAPAVNRLRRTRGPARVPRTPPGQPPFSMAGFDVVPGVGRLLFSGKHRRRRRP